MGAEVDALIARHCSESVHVKQSSFSGLLRGTEIEILNLIARAIAHYEGVRDDRVKFISDLIAVVDGDACLPFARRVSPGF